MRAVGALYKEYIYLRTICYATFDTIDRSLRYYKSTSLRCFIADLPDLLDKITLTARPDYLGGEMQERKVSVRQMDRYIGQALFLVAALRFTAWLAVAGSVLMIAADPSWMMATVAVIGGVLCVGGGTAILAEVMLDHADRLKMRLAAEVARIHPHRTQRMTTILGAVYAQEDQED